MSNDKKGRCNHCGGTLWQDGDGLKCVMCSRPAGRQGGFERVPDFFSNPKLPGTPRRNPFRGLKS